MNNGLRMEKLEKTDMLMLLDSDEVKLETLTNKGGSSYLMRTKFKSISSILDF